MKMQLISLCVSGHINRRGTLEVTIENLITLRNGAEASTRIRHTLSYDQFHDPTKSIIYADGIWYYSDDYSIRTKTPITGKTPIRFDCDYGSGIDAFDNVGYHFYLAGVMLTFDKAGFIWAPSDSAFGETWD